MGNKKYLVEYSDWLNSEITQRYAVSQHQQKRPKGRHALSDAVDVEAVDTGYNGYFKVIWDNEVDEAGNITNRRVKVINGADPASVYCGVTDIGSVHTTVIPITGPVTISLFVTYTEETGYMFEFGSSRPQRYPYGQHIIAEIVSRNNDLAINQVWTGGAIYFGSRYFI